MQVEKHVGMLIFTALAK